MRTVQQLPYFFCLLLWLSLSERSFAYFPSTRTSIQSYRQFSQPAGSFVRSPLPCVFYPLPLRRQLVHVDSSTGRLTTVAPATLSSIFDSSSTAEEERPDNQSLDTSAFHSESRLRRLKDLMWIRETREDLTAAEFACSVEAQGQEEEDQADRRKRKRAVDYEKLLAQLNRRIRDIGCAGTPRKDDSPFYCALKPGVGMSSIVYTMDQREALLERIIRTRQMLVEVIKGDEESAEDDLPFSIVFPDIRVEIPKEEDPTSPGPKLYVRDDGTVDWDGALQDREALRKFGTAVWARINGRDSESINEDETLLQKGGAAASAAQKPKEVTAKIEETQQIKQAWEELSALTRELKTMERNHIALLNSAISAGQAVANVNLASLEPKLRIRIMESDDELEMMKEKVTFHTLVYELERIYSYLMGELGNPALTGYIPLQDRLNVAEFGLLESQIESFNQQIDDGESVDADVLAVIMDQLTDFKRRLGIDYYVTGLSFDGDGIRRWLGELLIKSKKSLAFYVKGVRLFWNDIVFCLSLINRAAQGYTLKPREVRTIRRTFKDIITFIPVVIILLIPLSPIGHVLVFGAIQRFFPDFFPSCFTEQRQNLLQLYESAEYSEFSIKENWKEKLSRLSEAILYVVTNTTRTVYLSVMTLLQGESSKSSDSDKDKQ